MRGAVIQVVTGDITKETTDVIVNSSNDTFSLKSGMSSLDVTCKKRRIPCDFLC